MDKPLFIPLRGTYYDAFNEGRKTDEYRLYGPRWNERTCHLGRPVVISRGYGKQQRRTGHVASFRQSRELTPGFRDCYPHAGPKAVMAVITLKLDPV